ncbi:MAG TPA: hypothetical protein VM286_03560 [Candidatus Thermoplasmatota archaeon]|nr:hypothetical protein [Candidatus Thermoplasmatota archaeon]
MRWGWLAGLVLLLPLVAADEPAPTVPFTLENPTGPTTTTLYFHFGISSDFLINTQLPHPWKDATGGNGPGIGGGTLTCLPRTGVTEGTTHRREASTYGISLAGPVEYDFMESGGPNVPNPQRVLGGDVRLDPGEPLAFTWFVVSDLQGQSMVPMLLPQVRVQATLRSGSQFAESIRGYDGEVLAQGSSPTATLAGSSTTGATYERVQGRDVYGFSFPLRIATDNATLPRDGGFSLRVDLFLDVPACPDPEQGAVMPRGFEPFADPEHMPRLSVIHADPLRIASATMETFPEGHVFSVEATSPWGTYDVDAPGIRLDILGPPTAFVNQTALVWRTHEFDHYADPARSVWVWDHRHQPPTPGTYTATITVPNRQHTANATAHLTFEVGPKASPATGPLALLLLLATAAVLRRRPMP